LAESERMLATKREFRANTPYPFAMPQFILLVAGEADCLPATACLLQPVHFGFSTARECHGNCRSQDLTVNKAFYRIYS